MGGSDDVCPVCLDEFEDARSIEKTACGHRFHTSCLETWRERHPDRATCPTCRRYAGREGEEIVRSSQARECDGIVNDRCAAHAAYRHDYPRVREFLQRLPPDTAAPMFTWYAVHYRRSEALRIAAEERARLAYLCMEKCAVEGYNEGLDMLARTVSDRWGPDHSQLRHVRDILKEARNSDGLAIVRDVFDGSHFAPIF